MVAYVSLQAARRECGASPEDAVKSLAEGLEETLTLCRLGWRGVRA